MGGTIAVRLIGAMSAWDTATICSTVNVWQRGWNDGKGLLVTRCALASSAR